MFALYSFAMRLLECSKLLSDLETATGLMAFATYDGAVDERRRGMWDTLYAERNVSDELPVRLDKLVERLRSLAGEGGPADVLKRLVERRLLPGDAHHSTRLRTHCLRQAAGLLSAEAGEEEAAERTALGHAMLVAYLHDLRVYGECTIGEEERAEFDRVFGLDYNRNREVSRAYGLIWLESVWEVTTAAAAVEAR